MSSSTTATNNRVGRNQQPIPLQSRNTTTPNNSNSSSTNNTTFAMIVVLGMVGTAAGFTAYTKRSTQMLKQLETVAKNKQRRMPPSRIGPLTKHEWDKVRPRFDDKDDFI